MISKNLVGSGSSHSPGETTGKGDSAAKSNITERKRRRMEDLSLDDLEEQDVDWWYFEKKRTVLTNVSTQQKKKMSLMGT